MLDKLFYSRFQTEVGGRERKWTNVKSESCWSKNKKRQEEKSLVNWQICLERSIKICSFLSLILSPRLKAPFIKSCLDWDSLLRFAYQTYNFLSRFIVYLKFARYTSSTILSTWGLLWLSVMWWREVRPEWRERGVRSEARRGRDWEWRPLSQPPVLRGGWREVSEWTQDRDHHHITFVR